MPDNETIFRSYKLFSSAVGNQHIASKYAITKLQELIEYFQMQKILEVGLGIGSIAGTLLALNKELDYSGTEANDFCLKSLPENLGDDFKRLEIFNGLSDIPSEKQFDLVIIDGKDTELEVVKRLIKKRGIIAIEGDRIPQEDILRNIFPRHKFVHCISSRKNPSYSPFPLENWQGGIKVIFTDPDLKQDLWRTKEKIKTKMKYWIIRKKI